MGGLMAPPVASITFFKSSGDMSACHSKLRARIVEVVKANPWLVCRFVRNKKEHNNQVQIVFSASPADTDVDKIINIYKDPGALEVHWDMDYQSLTKAIAASPSCVKKGSECVNKSGDEFQRACFTLVPVAKGDNAFALILSMCHVLGDGHTYYQILNMLSKKEPIKSLQMERHKDFEPKGRAAVGQKNYAWATGGGVLFNVIKNTFVGKAPRCMAYYVDSDRIAVQKKAVPAGNFVSTNDLICSHFFKRVQPRVGFMVINWRNRIAGVEDQLAGNYDGALIYDPDGYADAMSIRKSLTPVEGCYQTAQRPLPGTCESMWCKLGMATNWASFARDLVIDGCEQHLHLPCVVPSDVPFEFCVIFRPRAGKLGVMCFVRGQEDLTAGDSIFQETISSSMFST